MSWKTIKVGDFGKVITGNTPPKNRLEFYGKDYKFIKPTDMEIGMRYTPITEEYYSLEGYKKYKNSVIPPFSTCVVTIGSIGKKITLSDTYCFVNQAVNAVVPDIKKYDPYFVFYALKNMLHKVRAADTGASSGRENVSKSNFSGLTLNVPKKLETQQKIASILSAYDDLIENNLKRIRLLEEAAQHLYREWFVKFRFPGWEEVKMVDGLPEGWEKRKLGEIALIEWGDTSVTKAKYIKEGYNAFSASGCDGRLSYFDFDRTGIVLSAIGAYAGQTWFAIGKWSAIKNTLRFWSKIENVSDEYLFLATYGMNYWMRRGSAQPFIALGDARVQLLTVPNQNVIIHFTQKIRPLFLQIDLLIKQNQKLNEARDLLLPRLMNQMIEV